MLKVLHVSAAAERGGLEVVLLNLVRALDRSRFSPLVLFLSEGPFVREVEAVGAEVHVRRAGRVRNLLRGARVVAGAVRLIRTRGVGLVHTYNAKAHVYGGLAAALAGVPCLYHFQGVPVPGLTAEGLIGLLSLGVPARRRIGCSHYIADAFTRAWRSRREITVIHNGVSLDALGNADGSGTVRRQLQVPEEAPLVVMAGRLQEGKGVHVFLDAAARAVRVVPQARFVVVGGALFGLDQHYPGRLRDQAERLGLSGSVIFTGFRPDVYRFLAAADVVVQSAIRPESFSLVLVEAMALAKPVVATDLGGPREIVEDGVTGFLVPPDQPEPLARAILTLLGDPGRRRRMGEAGAARFRACFQADRMVRRFEEVYEEVVGNGGGRTR